MRDSDLRRAIKEFLGVVTLALNEAGSGPLDEDNIQSLTATAEVLGEMITRDDHAKLAWSAMNKETH
jgi:hypothetical protein